MFDLVGDLPPGLHLVLRGACLGAGVRHVPEGVGVEDVDHVAVTGSDLSRWDGFLPRISEVGRVDGEPLADGLVV